MANIHSITSSAAVDITNIARNEASLNLRESVVAGLSNPAGKRSLPTVVLYDEAGLKLYDAVTTEVKEYYLFTSEQDILRASADDIVRAMVGNAKEDTGAGAVVLELGAGALRKTSLLLAAFAEHAPRTTYYALDLEYRELVRTLGSLTAPGTELASFLDGRVAVRGLCGTYDDGIEFVESGRLAALDAERTWPWKSQPEARGSLGSATRPRARNESSSTVTRITKPLHILFLGSSIGNFSRDGAAAFLKSLPLRPGSGDTLLLGLDGRNGKRLVESAYRDPAGHNDRFVLNGLQVVERILGTNSLDASKWAYENRFNEDLGTS